MTLIVGIPVIPSRTIGRLRRARMHPRLFTLRAIGSGYVSRPPRRVFTLRAIKSGSGYVPQPRYAYSRYARSDPVPIPSRAVLRTVTLSATVPEATPVAQTYTPNSGNLATLVSRTISYTASKTVSTFGLDQ